MRRLPSLCLLAAAVCHGAPEVEDEDLSALVQLDVKMRSRRTVASRGRQSVASRPSSASRALVASNASGTSDDPGSRTRGIPGATAASKDESAASVDGLLEDASAQNTVTVRPKEGDGEWRFNGQLWHRGYEEDVTLRGRLISLRPKFQQRCMRHGYGTPAECQEAADLLRMIFADVEASHASDHAYLIEMRDRLALEFFLWAPGPPMSFVSVDLDHNDALTWPELLYKFGEQAMAKVEAVRGILDPDHDGNITRTEMFGFLRSGILIRDQVREVDSLYPEAKTSFCLKHARKMFYRPTNEIGMPRGIKCIALVAIAISTAACIVWAECGSRRK